MHANRFVIAGVAVGFLASSPVTAAAHHEDATREGAACSTQSLHPAAGHGVDDVAGAPVCEPAAVLQAELDSVRAHVERLERLVAILETGIETLQARTSCMSSSGSDTYFTGCNVHVRDGSGDTDGEVTGLGNLIVGYNEAFVPGSRRTGSHNLVVGPEHSYTSFGALIAGFYNTVSAPHGSVVGGAFNTASMNRAVVGGGERNEASGLGAMIAGGTDNVAHGEHAAVVGGSGNAASGKQATVAGGASNSAVGTAAVVAGGTGNRASGTYAAVSGGELNEALALAASVGGGHANRAMGEYSRIVGGREVHLDAAYAAAGGVPAGGAGTETAGPASGEMAGTGPPSRPHPYADRRPPQERGPGSSWTHEAWAEPTRRDPADLGKMGTRDAPVGNSFSWNADSPFKLQGRDFNSGVGSPLAE